MREFANLNLMVREIVNGVMATTALLLIYIFGRYCWFYRRSFWQSKTTLCAMAILVLMLGHFARAFNTWMALVFSGLRIDASLWLKWTWAWFVISGALIVIGKSGMLYLFAPSRWRKMVLGIWIPLCVLIPIALAVAISH